MPQLVRSCPKIQDPLQWEALESPVHSLVNCCLCAALPAETGAHRTTFESCCRLIEKAIRDEVSLLHDRVIADYTYISPDATTPHELSPDDTRNIELRFLSNFMKVMEKGNFKLISPTELEVAESGEYKLSMPIEVN